MSKDYYLCSICEHTPAFCHCKNAYGLSRAECLRRQQEIIEEMVKENLFDNDELVLRKIADKIEEEYFENE